MVSAQYFKRGAAGGGGCFGWGEGKPISATGAHVPAVVVGVEVVAVVVEVIGMVHVETAAVLADTVLV